MAGINSNQQRILGEDLMRGRVPRERAPRWPGPFSDRSHLRAYQRREKKTTARGCSALLAIDNGRGALEVEQREAQPGLHPDFKTQRKGERGERGESEAKYQQ